MIKLMHINDYVVDTGQFRPLLNDKIVERFEKKIAEYVGAKYACAMNSATNTIILSLIEKEKTTVTIPSIIPPVVPNAVICAGHDLSFNDNIDWVGNSYVLHDFGDYKIIDSAQQLSKNQFKEQANDGDVMIFSFYPTKPVGSCDGGMFVSNDKEKVDRIRIISRNGMSLEKNSWERKIIYPGWKFYMNSIQAYIAEQNFHKLEQKMKRYEEIKEAYNLAFNKSNSSNHLYRISVEDNQSFIASMKEKGIQCGIHYAATHLMECYGKMQLDLPKSLIESKTAVSIPYHEMLTDEQVEYVINEVKNANTSRR